MNEKKFNVIMCDMFFIIMTIATFCMNLIFVPQIIVKILQIISLTIAFIVLCNAKYKKKEIVYIVMFGILMIIIYINSNILYLVTNIIALALLRDIELDKILTKMFYTKIILALILIMLLLLGIIHNETIYRITDNGENIIRNCLGFIHPNTAFWNFFTIVALYVYYKRNNMNKIDYLSIIIISGIMYKLTNSRTGIYCVFLLLILVFISNNFTKLFNLFFIKRSIIYSFSILTLISIIPSFLYAKTNIELFKIINEITSGRVYLGSILYKEYSISWFGTYIELVTDTSRLTIDNGFVYMSVVFGIVFMVMMSILYIKLFKKMYKDERYIEISLILVFFVYCMAEKVFFNIFTNFTIAFFVYLLYNNSNIKPKYNKKNITMESEKNNG